MSRETKIGDSWITKRRGAVYGYFPLATLFRLLGYFPLTNLNEHSVVSENATFYKLRFDVILTVSLFLITTYGNVNYYFQWPNYFVSNLRDTVHNIFFINYRFAASFIFIYFAVVKAKALVKFFISAGQADLLSFEWQSKCIALRKLGIALALATVLNVGSYVATFNSFCEDSHFYSSIADKVLTLTAVTCTLYSYNFFCTFVVFFNYFFKWQFQMLAIDLEEKLVSGLHFDHLTSAISAIRKRHEHLVILIENLNSICSPIIMIYVAAESFAICVNIYEFCLSFVQPQWDFKCILIMLKTLVFILNRLVPLMAMCYTSSSVTEEAKSGSKSLSSCSLTGISYEAEFQVLMLFEQLKKRQAEVKAFGVLTINNKLMAKIVGIIITYIILMMQINGINTSYTLK